MTNQPTKTVFAFDVGKGSLGICVRQGLEILELDSKLVDATYPCITANGRGLTTRVRMARTRQFHKARLTWLKRQWEQSGLTALEANSPAWSVEYQTGKYASGILLRCALLMGKTTHPDGTPFTDADLFKALYSAVRKRGYGDVVWKTTSDKPKDDAKAKKKESELTQEEKDEKANKERSASYLKEMATYTAEHYFYPCFMEAARLGLWCKINPTELETHLKNQEGFEPIRGEGLVAPRLLRIEEFEALFAKIQALRPRQLANINPRNWAEGRILLPFSDKTQRGFASYYATAAKNKLRIEGFPAYLEKELKDVRQCRGSKRSDPKGDAETPFDWQGVFNQKVPRFDNRIIAKCAVFGSRNVCKAEEPLAKDVKILLALKNMTFEVNTVLPDGLKTIVSRKLLPLELKELWQLFDEARRKQKEDKGTNKGLAPKWLDDHLAQVVGKDYQKQGEKLAKKRFEYVQKQTNDSGRSRFSRPALALVKALLLSGQSPAEFIGVCKGNGQLPAWKGNDAWVDLKPTQKEGITHAELEEASKKLGKTWEAMAIGDNRDAAFEASTALAEQFEGEALYAERLKAIYKRIGNVNNPVVRHRLELLIHQVHKLRKAHGTPAKVMIEFVREGLNKAKKKNHEQFVNDNKKRNERYEERLKANGLELTAKNITKMRLWEEQRLNGEPCAFCLYTGQEIRIAELDTGAVEVEHIVPRSKGGNNNLRNLILVKEFSNREKNAIPHFTYLKNKGRGQSFLDRVEFLQREKIKGLKEKDKHFLYLMDKYQILTATSFEQCQQVLDKYTGLAETGYIARLTQELIHFYFGWASSVEGQDRRIFVTNGHETWNFRKRYELDDLLYEGRKDEWEDLLKNVGDYRLTKKFRENDKHHALDAYAISFAQESRQTMYEFAPFIKPVLQKELTVLSPQNIKSKTKALDFRGTIYGMYQDETGYFITLHKTFNPVKDSKNDADEEAGFQEKDIPNLVDERLKKDLQHRLERGETWSQIKNGYRYPDEKRSNIVKKVLVKVSKTPLTLQNFTFVTYGRKRKGYYYQIGSKHLGFYLKDPNVESFNNPQWIKTTKSSLGYFFVKDEKGNYEDIKVYPFNSFKTATINIDNSKVYKDRNGNIRFTPGCKVALSKSLTFSFTLIKDSKEYTYTDFTLEADQSFFLKTISGDEATIELSNGILFNCDKKEKNGYIIYKNPNRRPLKLLIQHGLYLKEE
jgi:CRISPR-associated endonuclease Csn1